MFVVFLTYVIAVTKFCSLMYDSNSSRIQSTKGLGENDIFPIGFLSFFLFSSFSFKEETQELSGNMPFLRWRLKKRLPQNLIIRGPSSVLSAQCHVVKVMYSQIKSYLQLVAQTVTLSY